MFNKRLTASRRSLQVLWAKLDQHVLPHAGEGVVLAVSGGPDSRALLEACARWPNRLGRKLVVASIDHGIRPQSEQEAQYIVNRARRLGFVAELKRLSHLGHFAEHDLRAMRYHALEAIAHKHHCQAICTAHHLDDNAEGYLMSILGVGGGAMGAAMPDFDLRKGYKILRPFNTLSKKQLLLCLTLLEQTDFAIDNLDEAKCGERASVRHDLLPALLKKNTKIAERLNLFAKTQAAQSMALKDLANQLIDINNLSAKIDLSSRPDSQVVNLAIRQVLKTWGDGVDLRSSRTTIEKIIHQLRQGKIISDSEAGLDRPLNGFNVKHLEAKVYQFPVAAVKIECSEIVFERV